MEREQKSEAARDGEAALTNPYASPRSPAETAPPSLYHDHGFWGLTATQFLGAFNDNLFKQLLLLLAITGAAGLAAASGDSVEDRQWLAQLVFALPFLAFSGIAGYFSDRHSKRRLIVLMKCAEVVIMALGMAAFLAWNLVGYNGLLVVLFLVGTHSAFFGPAKYGILPEMLAGHDLPRANGIFLMTTFLAIIFGQASAGALKEFAGDRLWMASAVCVAIAVAGTLTSLLTPRAAAARPNLKFTWSAWTVPPDIRELLRRDHSLLAALWVSSWFWLVAAVANLAVNSLGVVQLAIGDARTSVLLAAIGIGIAAGSVLAGVRSRGAVNFRVMQEGAWGLVGSLAAIAVLDLRGASLGFWGNLPLMVLLGVATGMFAVPVQVFLQSRPPEGQKGRMIGAMNQANWIGVVLSSVIYYLLDLAINAAGLPRCTLFGILAAGMLPVAIGYHPANRALK